MYTSQLVQNILPTLCPHPLNPRNRLLERKLKQLPPPFHPQILPHLPAPNMKLLPTLLLQNPILRTRHVQHAQRRGDIETPLRIDVHLTTEFGAQFQFHPAHGGSIVVCSGGGADGAGEGGVGVIGVGAGVLGWPGAGAVAEVDVVQDLIEFGGRG